MSENTCERNCVSEKERRWTNSHVDRLASELGLSACGTETVIDAAIAVIRARRTSP